MTAPTSIQAQALLDLYTIDKEMREQGRGIDALRIALVGDLKYGRAVHSLCKVLALFRGITFQLVSPPGLELADDLVDALRARGHGVNVIHDMEAGIRHVDIVYVTRTQEERFPSPEAARRYRGLFRLNQAVYTEHCEPNTVIMHPMPRDSRMQARELDEDLDANPNLAIFRQTDNGVILRMALFAMVLNVADRVHVGSQEVHWYTAQAHAGLATAADAAGGPAAATGRFRVRGTA